MSVPVSSMINEPGPSRKFQGRRPVILSREASKGTVDTITIFYSVLEKFLHYPAVAIELTGFLDLNSLVNLYSIHRPFHHFVESNLSNVVHAQIATLDPDSVASFPYSAFPGTTKFDPTGRPSVALPGTIRRVPTLKWLNMIAFRDQATKDIISVIEQTVSLLPQGSSLTLKRIWQLMDRPTTQVRAAALRNQFQWTDHDLRVAVVIFLKLDLCFSDPIASTGERLPGLRELLLSQRSLSTMRDVLLGRTLRTALELIRCYLESFRPPDIKLDGQRSIFGVPVSQVGRLGKAGWSADSQDPLSRIDGLILEETVRRRMELHMELLPMLLSGQEDYA